mgnify:CR=1 FL=1
MAQATILHGTASQRASAEMHLERREDWRYIRVAGTRYVVLPSGHSGSTHWVRDDARGCSCLFYAKTFATCSHMISVRMANEADAQQVPSLKSYRDLFPGCAGGCGDLVDGPSQFCDRCSSDQAHQQEMAAKRRAVAAGRG